MNKKLTYAGISALLLLVIAGCGDKPTAAPAGEGGLSDPAVVNGAGGNNGESGNAAGENAEASPQPTAEATASPTAEPTAVQKQSQSISVYYTDPQQMDLVAAEATVTYEDDEEKYTEAFKALQSSTQAEIVPLWGKIELKSLEFKDGQVVMDIHKPDEAQLGAGGESLAIGALTKTLFQFPEVLSIDVLVDGEQIESLMGHVDLEHPMTRENSES